MQKLNETALWQLIKGGETSTVELKVASPRPDEMAERLCGLANAQGGFIIIGIADESLDIVGIPDKKIAQTKDVILRAMRQIIKPELLLDPSEPEVYVVDGKKLVVATVPPNRGAVYQVSGVFWVRRGTYTVPLTVSEIMELAHDRGLVSWEKQIVREATMKDIDVELVRAYINQRAGGSGQSSRLSNLERVLTGMGCAKATPDGTVRPTYAGILFFGHDPQQYILQSEVVCVLFRDELGVGRYVDRKIVKGTLQKLIDETEAFLNKYVAVGAEIVGWRRIDLPEYPLEALREAVVNAIVHRDYSRVGESIRVFYYTDRVEIHSPGLLLPGITVKQMQRGDVTSNLRNPTLATLLRDIPGYMERIGSGIRFMLDETKRMGLQPPQFREMSEFVVTFRKAPVSSRSRARATSFARKESDPRQLTLDVLPGMVGSPNASSTRVLDQKVRIELAMRHIHEHGSILNREYRDLTGVSEQTAMRDLEMLVEQGTLKKVGKTRSRQYKLP